MFAILSEKHVALCRRVSCLAKQKASATMMSNVLSEHAIFLIHFCHHSDKWLSHVWLWLWSLSRGHFWAPCLLFFILLASEVCLCVWVRPDAGRVHCTADIQHTLSLSHYICTHADANDWEFCLRPPSLVDGNNSSAVGEGILKTICAVPYFVFVLLNFIQLD